MKYTPIPEKSQHYSIAADDGRPIGIVWFRFNGWEILPHGARVQILERFTSRDKAARAALKKIKICLTETP